MADTLCSVSEETPLKLNLTSDSKNSESVVNQISKFKDGDANAKFDQMPSSQVCVPPTILVNDIFGSLSVLDFVDLKDINSITKKRRKNKKRGKKDQKMRASVLSEGQQGEEAGAVAESISCEPNLRECGWTRFSLAKASKAVDDLKHLAMERAELSPYTSDEWEEESAISDTDGDHTDSSDDDDPKSQVDRLIERGTLMYIEGENSALSSEGETDDDEDDSEEYDSESDITDVSPLVSATASPLGLSPVLPRRTIPKSPLALHDNRNLYFGYKNQSPFSLEKSDRYLEEKSDRCLEEDVGTCDNRDSTNMDLLLKAVIELENGNQSGPGRNNLNQQKNPNSGLPRNRDVYIHPIRDNPHHIHLRRNYLRRKNMSFSNEEVRKIDCENKILLRKIMAAHTKPPAWMSHSFPSNRSYHNKPSNSSVNRKKDEEKIQRDNLLLLRKIQEVKPSREVDTRIPAGGSFTPNLSSSPNVSNRSLQTPSSSCGAFMRSISQPPHVTVSPPRKETAL